MIGAHSARERFNAASGRRHHFRCRSKSDPARDCPIAPVWHAQCIDSLRRQVNRLPNIDVDIDTNFPDRSVQDALDKINAERSRKRFIALSGIALALFALALSTYLAYA